MSGSENKGGTDPSVDSIVHRLCAESRKYREIAKRESSAQTKHPPIALSAMSKADAYDHAVGIVIALSPGEVVWAEPERTRVLQAAGLALEAIDALQDDKDGSLISPARLALRKCLDGTADDVFASAKDLRANKLNRGRLETLERRRDYLLARVEADSSLKFDAAECAALRWAIRVLRQMVR